MEIAPDASPPSKKRRIPKACAACRKSKVRCDEKRPCTRCVQSATTCTWHEKLKDPVDERLDRVEQAIWAISGRLDEQSNASPCSMGSHQPMAPTSAVRDPITGPSVPIPRSETFSIREPSCGDIVSAGLVSDADAQTWFRCFFHGCDRFVPIFDFTYDTYHSVKGRSSILFDVLVIYGCRAAVGSLSKAYQDLYHTIRKHTSDLALHEAEQSLERIQALLVIASYSDSGATLCDIALRHSLHLDLPRKVTTLFSTLAINSGSSQQNVTHDLILYTSVRIWYGLFVLDQILSLDGGKPPSMSLQSTSRRVRALLTHPYRTSLDLRLFAQVELNELRASSYANVVAGATTGEQALKEAIDDGLLDLSMWHSEWQAIINSNVLAEDENTVFAVNLRVQHAWAMLTLQLRALTASGVENIALMIASQREIAFAAKQAAERHLELLLTSTPSVLTPGTQSEQSPWKPYVANFRYAMEFVWAKNAFCVLIVLRLGILLCDPLPTILKRLQQARDFLTELSKVGMGTNISYNRILSQTVKKCQHAVEATMIAQDAAQAPQNTGNDDFQSFVPHEFVLEWDFPGLHLCYIPLDWQDLFLDFTAIA